MTARLASVCLALCLLVHARTAGAQTAAAQAQQPSTAESPAKSTWRYAPVELLAGLLGAGVAAGVSLALVTGRADSCDGHVPTVCLDENMAWALYGFGVAPAAAGFVAIAGGGHGRYWGGLLGGAGGLVVGLIGTSVILNRTSDQGRTLDESSLRERVAIGALLTVGPVIGSVIGYQLLPRHRDTSANVALLPTPDARGAVFSLSGVM